MNRCPSCMSREVRRDSWYLTTGAEEYNTIPQMVCLDCGRRFYGEPITLQEALDEETKPSHDDTD